MRTVDMWLINAQTRMMKAKENVKDFFTSERGVSNVVATIIILLIVVLVIGVFWDRLQVFLDGMMDTIFNSTPKVDPDKLGN